MRIATTTGQRVRGYCGPIESTQLRIERGAREQVVPFTAVDSVRVRLRGSGAGATAGALGAGGAGVLLAQGL